MQLRAWSSLVEGGEQHNSQIFMECCNAYIFGMLKNTTDLLLNQYEHESPSTKELPGTDPKNILQHKFNAMQFFKHSD